MDEQGRGPRVDEMATKETGGEPPREEHRDPEPGQGAKVEDTARQALRAQIPDYLDGVLEAGARASFEAALAMDQELRDEVEDGREARKLLHHLTPERLEADVFPAVRQRLRDRALARQPALTVTLEVVIGASILLFVAAFMLLSPSAGDAPATPCGAEDLGALLRGIPASEFPGVEPNTEARADGDTALRIPTARIPEALLKGLKARGCTIKAHRPGADGSTTLIVTPISPP